MKDPLNPERTPYEVLGIERGATPTVQHEAYLKKRAEGAKIEDLQWARATLKDPERVAVVDVFEYDSELFARLRLGALDLTLPSRERTRERLESELKDWINRPRAPGEAAAIGHALFVLSYFSGFVRGAEAGSDPFQRQIWQRTIGYFGFLCTNAGQLLETCGEEPVRRRIEVQLLAREEAGATGYDELRAMIPVELRAARELRARKLADSIGFGPLLAETLGFRGALADAISHQQRRSPGDEGLRFLAGVFKGFGAIYALRERGDFSAALAALDGLPPAQRALDEAENVRAEILFELGKTLAADVAARNETQVMAAWAAACEATKSPAFRAEIETEIETYSVRRATELARFELEDAVELLRRARRSADTSKVRAGLLNMLRQYAHAVHEDGNRVLAERLLAEARQIASSVAPTSPPSPGAEAIPRRPTPDAGPSARPGARPAPTPVAPPSSGDAVSLASSLRESGQLELAIEILTQVGPVLSGVQASEARRELAACLTAKAERDVGQLLAASDPEQLASVEHTRRLARGIDQAYAELRRASELDPQNREAPRAMERLLELREAIRRAEAPRRSPAPTAPPGSTPVRRSFAANGGNYRSPGHVAILLLSFTAAAAASWWLVRSPQPWVEAVRRETSAFLVLTPLVDTYGPRLLWTLALALLLAPSGLGWLSESAKNLLRFFTYPFIVRWNRRGAFSKMVEYLLLASLVGVFSLAGQALYGRFHSRANQSSRVTASMVSAQPAAPRPSANPEQQRVSRLLDEVSKLDPAGASSWVTEFEKARTSSSGARRADDFVLAAALEQSREEPRAKATYKLLAAGKDAYARSSRLRLVELGATSKPGPEAYVALAAEHGDGWFKIETVWEPGVIEQRVARHRLEAQSSKASVRVLSAIREQAPPPAERAYWFVFGVMVLAFKLLQLPFTWKSSEIVARLRLLEPERRALMAKFSGDSQARGLAMMELYRKHNVNFSAGCLGSFLELGIVVWALFAMTAFAPQWGVDGARFFWLNDITLWDHRVAGLWVASQVLMALANYRQNDSDPTTRAQFIAALLLPLALFGMAFYFKLPACVFIFLTLLSLTSLVLRTSLSKIQSLRYG